MRIPVHGLLVLSLLLFGCGGLVSIAEQIRDDDDDGWFNNPKNQATTLTLDSGIFSVAGEYRFIVDGIRFPMAPDLEGSRSVELQAAGRVVTLGFPVARRASGTSLLSSPSTGMPYSAAVRVQRKGLFVWEDVGTATVAFTNADATLPAVTVGSASLTFSTARVFFADPNPQDANGDSDGDGITEMEEGRILSEGHGGIGDPRPGITNPSSRDLVLILTWTDAASAPDPGTIELLRSRFAFRGINLWLDDGTLNGLAGFGGQVASPAAPPVSIAAATTTFNSRVPVGRRRFVHFAMLTPDMVGVGTGTGFGVANFPGQVLVTKSHLAPPLPDIRDYQAGVLMHELGHNLNLCHPTVVPCPSGTLPPAERDPGATIMGTPAENPPVIVNTGILGITITLPDPLVLINAMSRPLDYTPAQWTNLSLTAGLPPP